MSDRMHAPPLMWTLDREREILEQAFAAAARGRTPLRILEAGCGRRWLVDLKGIAHEITGVDLDADALAHRREVTRDLHHAVHGDLAAVTFDPGSFDVVYCSFVLEHVRGAEQVLDRMVSWLAPGGRLILRIPARESVAGWLTRLLPFRLHVWFYRRIAEYPDAGKPGHPPYPVFHEPVVSLAGVRAFCARHGLRIEGEYGADFAHHYRHLRLTRWQRLKLRAVTGLIAVVGALSFGALTSRYSGLLFVIGRSA
jgi:SAM-dependent methyltransferase